MGNSVKKASKVDINDIKSVVKMLNNKKTTIEDVLTKLQDLVQDFQNIKEDFYIEELREQVGDSGLDEDEDIDSIAERMYELIQKDTKGFVSSYIQAMNDCILDAINQEKVKKEPAHAFLVLLQIMESAFSKDE